MNTHYAIYIRCLVFAMELKLQQVLYLIFLLVAKPFNVWMKHVRHDNMTTRVLNKNILLMETGVNKLPFLLAPRFKKFPGV